MIIAFQALLFFRETFVTVIERFLGPYYRKLSLSLKFRSDEEDDNESDDHVFAEYDDEKGVVFYPPVYVQRYAAVSDCLMDERWCGKLEKVVDLGYHDMSFIRYLKDVPGIKQILGVDIESIPLRCSSDLLGCDNYIAKRENPLQVTLFQGNAADPDYRLIGCDAVVAIEMIEHMLPHDLERLIHTVFGFIKPWVAIFTTPNGDVNVLFKALQKNGLRRLDHMFEWSREQFHDWCSNIVARYPEYTVSCKGIGPGPPDTLHLGCCSQLALFVAKDYTKQPDLDLNTLALVAKTSSPNNLSHIIDNWESPDSTIENNMICAPPRLNCSTFLVKKFSKATQNLMAKNKMDSYVHTHEIVNLIRHLTNMLNFNKEHVGRDFEGTWCNINWGTNAPYWNQYYRIVREYRYPFEVKTDETRIVDLITEEINRLVDMEYDEELTLDMHKLEIPVSQLMRAVEHITTDVDKVKELLVWNGYEVEDNLVIHSRLKMDDISEVSQGDDWQEDSISDWDTTEVRSTSFSDGSTIVPDYYGLRLRRAIDQKVRKLRTLLTADKDITTELDRVVCRLMKLALCMSKGRQNPPPISWMQCKLFDLLTLTEKSVERRRLQEYSLKAIEYQYKDIISHGERKMDHTCDLIVSKYQNLDLPPDYNIYTNDDSQMYDNSEFEDYNISITSNEFKDEFLEHENSNIREEPINVAVVMDLKEVHNIHDTELLMEETGQLDKCRLELVPHPSCRSVSGLINCGESTCSTSNSAGKKQEKLIDNYKISIEKNNINGSEAIKTQNKPFPKKRSNGNFASKYNRHKASKTNINKKVSIRRSSYINVLKYDLFEYKRHTLKERKQPKEYRMFQSTISRPIPSSLIELCDSVSNKNLEKFKSTVSNSERNELCQLNSDNAVTEEFIGIVTEDDEETIDAQYNIGISRESDLDSLKNEDVLDTIINLSKDDSYCILEIEPEEVQSQTIFLYDLDEPSTSKGVHHLSTDVQCGPDVTTARPMMSQSTSFTRMPKLFTIGIKIEEPITDMKTYDLATCTEMCHNNDLIVDRTSVRIKPKESIPTVTSSFTMTQAIEDKTTTAHNFDLRTETKLLKPELSALKTEDSGSEFCGNEANDAKSSTRLAMPSKNTSDFQTQCVSNEKNVVVKISQASYDRASLVCGNVHVHSFNARQVSEDVVYLGEWQLKQQLQKRNRISTVRKIPPLPKRQKLCLKQHSRVDEIKRFSNKIASETNSKLTVKNQERLNKTAQNKKKYLTDPGKGSKINTVKKVPSKIAQSSHVSKNMKTIYTTKKRTSINTNETIVKKGEENQKNKKVKNYLPLYLRRKIRSSAIENNTVDNKSQNEIDLKSENIIINENLFSPRNPEEITKDLIKIPENTLLTNINYEYMIFRNKIQTENDSNIKLPIATGMIKSDNLDYSHSSQHSSTCSSPNSIATVRTASVRNRVTCNQINSTSSERSSSGILESEIKNAKNKKFSRRAKINKKSSILSSTLCDNKENLPESSKNTKTSSKSMFLGRTKSVFVAQMTTETSALPLPSTNISKTKMQILTKSLKSENTDTCSTDDQSYEAPSSSIFEASLDEDSKNNDTNYHSFTSVSDNNEFIESSSNNIFENDAYPNPNEADDEYLNSRQSIHNTKSSIISAIRKLIESKLNLPENSYDCDSDSETVILSRDDDYVSKCNNSFSPTSIGTVNTIDLTCGSESDVDYWHNNCPSTVNENDMVLNTVDLKRPDTESDGLSIKSFASMSTSKFSEYYLADNELESAVPQVDTLNISSIQDIFERKELNTVPNVSGVLAAQAFSGFSVNEPLTGDQPDFVNFIDSETGSIAFRSARQAASEEVFVSGRSSDTYESCYVDEDAYLPNWLFNMISQQQSAEESEAEEINLPLQMPMEEPGFDLNGNVTEPGVGVGAGAGDGRGMHSDHSQDSSGRGTSLSSSETSSGPQSEAILSDPSNFTEQVAYSREPINMSVTIGAPSRPEASTISNAAENSGADTSNHQSRSTRSLINPVQVTSDIDADVSSLETDAIYSDN
ncbi:uncharacterized protein LOC123864895 isoform X2 [Maniola jurtina]|uniref:uncharacterized protein LOC123864895 isoform X2 n=1 Tax=Maniola jurtina TaxID=191418 RepID=UPI001E68C712|nr:uncharacterized protein LOC123864895 isoform X2 [Maniola jurtina]